MAITIDRYDLTHVHAGQNGYMEFSGVASFTGGDTEGTIEVPFAQIREASFTPMNAASIPVSGDQIGIKQDHSGGVLERDANRAVTVARQAGTTAGLSFFFRFRGH